MLDRRAGLLALIALALSTPGSGNMLSAVDPATRSSATTELAACRMHVPAPFCSAGGPPAAPVAPADIDHRSNAAAIVALDEGSGSTPATGAPDARGGADLRPGARRGGLPAETLNGALSRTLWLDDFGAAGDGVTDDSAKLVAAVYARQAAGTIVRLSCGKNYFIGRSVMLGAPGVTVEGCFHHPTLLPDAVGSADRRFLGSINTLGRITRAPGATIFIGMGGGLRDLFILQEGLVVPMPDASAYAGTAVAPGGKGSAAHLDDVLIIGARTCVDGSQGATPIELRHVDCDGVNGIVGGQSAGSSVYDDVDVSVFGTQDFPGFPVTDVAGDGTTMTLTFTFPSRTTPRAFPVGDLVTLPATPGASPYGYRITASSVSGSTGTVSFADPFHASSAAVRIPTVVEYTRQFLRIGTGVLFPRGVGSDDTHLGRVADFGHAIGFDFQSHGIFNVDHIWTDNNRIGVRIGLPASGGDPGVQVVQAHFGSVFAAGIGGIGVQVNSPSLAALTSVLVDKLSVIGVSSDCTQFTGQVSVGMMHVEGCRGFGVNVTAGSKLTADAIDAKVSTIGGQVLVPGQPAENVQVAHITTDGPAGGSLYGGVQRRAGVLASAPTLLLPITAVDGTVETYAIGGSSRVTTVNACWGGRTVRFIITGTASFAPGGNIATVGSKAIGGASGTVLTLFCDANTGAPTWRQMQ